MSELLVFGQKKEEVQSVATYCVLVQEKWWLFGISPVNIAQECNSYYILKWVFFFSSECDQAEKQNRRYSFLLSMNCNQHSPSDP